MLSLVPGYMVVSWTLRLPAVGVRVTCGVEGRPEGEEGRRVSEMGGLGNREGGGSLWRMKDIRTQVQG